MRICIIGGSNLRWMPYLRYYEDVLKKLDISYDVLYRNRGRFDEKQGNALVFPGQTVLQLPLWPGAMLPTGVS